MNIAEQLETTLSSPDSGKLIVAIPKNCSIQDAKTLGSSISVRRSLDNSSLPQSIFMSDCSLVFAQREQFNAPEYKRSFLEKCKKLGNEVTIAVI